MKIKKTYYFFRSANRILFVRLIFPIVILFFLLITTPAFSQEEDLESLLEKEIEIKPELTIATFKSTRLINSHTIERMQKGDLDFRISHRFGEVNTGVYELFGLDYSSSYLAAEYGITDWLMTGIGRGTMQKTFHGFYKLSIIRQSSGKKSVPVSVSWMQGVSLNALKWTNPERSNYFYSRLSYIHQLLIARKFNQKFSLQIMPVLVHRNLVHNKSDKNDLYALGTGGRYKLTNRLAVTAEFFYVHGLNNTSGINYYHPISIGMDIETGSHVFQLMITNSSGILENHFIGETTGDIFDGGFRIGFNISRVFTLKKTK